MSSANRSHRQKDNDYETHKRRDLAFEPQPVPERAGHRLRMSEERALQERPTRGRSPTRRSTSRDRQAARKRDRPASRGDDHGRAQSRERGFGRAQFHYHPEQYERFDDTRTSLNTAITLVLSAEQAAKADRERAAYRNLPEEFDLAKDTHLMFRKLRVDLEALRNKAIESFMQIYDEHFPGYRESSERAAR